MPEAEEGDSRVGWAKWNGVKVHAGRYDGSVVGLGSKIHVQMGMELQM